MLRRLQWLLIGLLVFSLALAACTPQEPAEEPAVEEPAVEEPAVEEPVEEPAEEVEEPAEEVTEEATEEVTEEATEEAEAPPAGEAGTVIIGSTDQISSLDFSDAYATHDWEIMRNVNLTLMGYEPGTANIVPLAAADQPEISEDELTYTYTIAEDLMWPDGSPLVAGDFVRGVERTMALEGDVQGLVSTYVASVEAPDDQTVVFTLTAPRADFNQIVSGTPYMPQQEGQFPEDELEKFPETLYGVGPYMVTGYSANEQLVLEPNPNYGRGLPEGAPQRVIIRYFEDPTQMGLAIENGEIDVAWRILGPIEAARLGEIDGLTLVNTGGGGIRYLVPNHSMAPMDDPNVRQALAYLIDRDEIIDRAVQGRNDPLYSMVPPGFLGATEAFFDAYDSPNIEAAEELLAASGYSEDNPLEFDLWYPPEHYGTHASQIFQILEEQFEATPFIQVNLQTQEWSTYVGALTNSEYPIGYLGWFFDYPDTSNYLDPFAQSNFSPDLGVNYASPEMDQLLADAAQEVDEDARAALYEQAQELYAQDVVTIPLTIETEYAVLNDATIASVAIGPALVFDYQYIEFAQ
jgi:peptide/nickel transport system substrate-binding protein